MVLVLIHALQRAGTSQVLDLYSGAGGPWAWLGPALAEHGASVSVLLTDKFPSAKSTCLSGPREVSSIRYLPQAVDATRVPENLTGFRTMFSAFHHFRPGEARALLADAVRKRQGIAVFDGTLRSVTAMLLMVLDATPLIRPFRWSRLPWTYGLPVVPFVALFDGMVSCLRTYPVGELRDLTATLETQDYLWEVGELKGTAPPIPVTYLIGLPRRLSTDRTPPSVQPSIDG